MKGLCLLWLFTGLIILNGCGSDDDCEGDSGISGQMIFFDIQDRFGNNIFNNETYNIDSLIVYSLSENKIEQFKLIKNDKGIIIGFDAIDFISQQNQINWKLNYENDQIDTLKIVNGNALQNLACNWRSANGIVSFYLNANLQCTVNLSEDQLALKLIESSEYLLDDQGNILKPFIVTLKRE